MNESILKKASELKRFDTNSTRNQHMRAVMDAIQKVRSKRVSKMTDEAIQKAMKE